MRRLESYLAEVGYWLAWAFLWAGSGILFAILVGTLGFADLEQLTAKLWGIGVIYAFASVFLLLGLSVLVLILRVHIQRGRLVKEGPGGEIQISPGAIKDLVQEILRREVELPRFRVGLARAPEGIRIKVSADLGGTQSVVGVGEQIQRLLKERVEQHIGMEVAEVEVFTRAIALGRRAKHPEEVDQDEQA
jgi:uncharacterized alkaline shock family protein YloU